ncbi:MAG: gephyrin-like molybdotransferase Glp [Nitrososphaerales archaeon]
MSCIPPKAKRHGPKGYMPVDAALKKFLSYIDSSKIALPTEYVSLPDAVNRVLANDLASRIDMPPFVRAAMDGYAVISSDTKMASMKRPVSLDVIGKITAGEDAQYRVQSGKAVAIATGGMIPDGADAVVMVEYTELENNTVKIFKAIERGKNVALKGEDVKNGQILLKKGTWLTAQDVGLIAAVGVGKVPVFKKPKVAVFASGNELAEPGSKLDQTCIFESNRYMISCMIREFGGEVVDMGICKDDRDLISSKLREALKFDIVVVSGGSSVGEKDYVPDLINSSGKPGLLVHGVAMRPGSPTALGIIDGKPIINASGYPVSSFVAFYTFGRPLLFKILKTEGPPKGKLIARMAGSIHMHEEMRTFVRVNVVRHNGAYFAEPISASGASLLSTLTNSNGMVIVDKKNKLTKGEKVEVIPLRNIVGIS